MTIGEFINRKKVVKNEILEAIDKIKHGDKSLRKDFIDNHKSFILETISHALEKSTIPKNSPEFDIGLDAFNHSIDSFNPDNDSDFLLFSEQIIKEWVLSYTREESSKYSLNQLDVEKYYLYCNYESSKDISHLKEQLWEFGIRLGDLPYYEPQNNQVIELCIKTARMISNSNRLFMSLFKNKDLPLQDLDEGIKPSKKVVNKYKKYIIALALILKSELKILCSYLKNIESGKESNENIGVILETDKDEAILFTLHGKFTFIKLSKGNKVGEQIRFGSYRIQKKDKNVKYIIAAWAVTSIMVLFALYQGYIMIRDNNKVVPTNLNVENSSKPGNDQNPLLHTTNPISTANIVVIGSAEPEIQTTPSPQNTDKPKDSKTSKPVLTVSEPSSTEIPAVNPKETGRVAPDSSPAETEKAGPSPTPVETEKADPSPTPSETEEAGPSSTPAETGKTGSSPTPVETGKTGSSPTPVETKANDVPDEVRISSDSYKVEVGQKYTVHMYLPSGNNGTSLVLYQNDIEHTRFNLIDRTPGPQARRVEINASESGTFVYRWELTNEFGTTSSKSITVKVLESDSQV